MPATQGQAVLDMCAAPGSKTAQVNHGLQFAIPMDNPYCSCKPTRVRTQIVDFLYEASDGRDRGMVMANGAEPKRRRAGGLDGFASSASLWFLQTVQRSREAETMALPATKVMSCR